MSQTPTLEDEEEGGDKPISYRSKDRAQFQRRRFGSLWSRSRWQDRARSRKGEADRIAVASMAHLLRSEVATPCFKASTSVATPCFSALTSVDGGCFVGLLQMRNKRKKSWW